MSLDVSDVEIVEAGNHLAIPGVITATGLVLPEDLSYDRWVSIGETLKRMEKSVQWWLGDWLRFGEVHYKGKYTQALDATDYSYQSLANMKYVADRVEFSRRRENVPWSHHAEVAALEPGLADELLERAAEEHLTREELRREVYHVKNVLEMSSTALKYSPSSDDAISIHHADCFEVIDSLAEHSVSLLLTDPPYRVTENEWDSQWVSEDAYWDWMSAWIGALRPKMALRFTAFIFCDADASMQLYDILRDTGWPVLRQCVWHRPNLAKKRTGSLTFLSSYEPFWHCGNQGLYLPDTWGAERFDVQTFVVPQSNHTVDPAYHPTQKPLALFRRLVQVGTATPDRLVLDPFCGSGTTPVACWHEGRSCVTCDTNEDYITIARGRLVAAKEGTDNED